MYSLKPPFVIVLDEVWNDPQMKARAERVLKAIPPDTHVETVSLEQLPEAAQRLNWHKDRRRAGINPPGDPGLLLGVMRWDGKFKERMAAVKEVWPEAPGPWRAALGYDAFLWCDAGMNGQRPCDDIVCRPAWRVHLTNGCPHKCFYCGLGGIITAMMNVEEYIVHLDELAQANPWEKTFLFEDDSEAFALEPEYGAVEDLANYMAGTPDRYLLIHTKSANVDFLEHIPEAARKRIIIVWSLTARTQSAILEAGSGTMEQRIEAARKCHEWGITTRFKFKPIVPVKGWREEVSEMTRLVFEHTHPDLISLFTLCWMDYADLIKLVDTEMLDPVYLEAARQAAEELGKSRVRPFPEWVRREIYEFCLDKIRSYDQNIPVVICTESLSMWKELGPKLKCQPDNYVCGCGPMATPWLKHIPHSPWEVSHPVGVEGYPAPY
jgi:hypothetical protein